LLGKDYDSQMSKSYHCRVADGLAEVLDLWAAKEGSKPTTIATNLLEQGIRQAIADGIAPSFDEVKRAKQEKEQDS
jgi:hypothetical protein